MIPYSHLSMIPALLSVQWTRFFNIFTSELLDTLEEMFSRYYMRSDMLRMLNSTTTPKCHLKILKKCFFSTTYIVMFTKVSNVQLYNIV